MVLALFDIKWAEVMVTRQWADERSKQGNPNPRRLNVKRDEIFPPRHECRLVPCSRATYCRHDNYYSSIFPTISGRYPDYFWVTSLTGIAYAWEASFRRCPMTLSFNESDKGRTRRLFLFRESEKSAEKKTPGGSFFIKLCLSIPKKYKTMLERTTRP